ncbi:Alkaline phosphatase synthesis sensor protein PhoR [bacterium HR36]|nr:Alkaline phosphatase synthesis sensor protein PhoR [bacterium HR36]
MEWLILEILLAVVIGSLIGWLVGYWRGRGKPAETGRGRNQDRLPWDLPGRKNWLLETLPAAQNADQLHLTGRWLLDAMDAVGEGVLVLDSSQTVQAANRTAAKLLETKPSDLSGSKIWQVVQHRPFLDALEHVHQGATVTAEVRWHHPREQLLRLYAFALPRESTTPDAPLPNPASPSDRTAISEPPAISNISSPGPILVLLRDITEWRRLEQYRRDFLGNVSHELKTPLAAIQAAAETLQPILASEPQAAAKFVQIILDNAERLSRLIQDMLQLGRIEAGEQTWHKEMVALSELIPAVVERHQPRATQKGLQLLLQPGTEPVFAWVDADALTRILENLLDNAIKYTRQGQITIRWWQAERHAVVEVADTGEGIAPEHLPRIFERFYRVDKGRSRDQGGSGLGLAIVKHLVQAMDGALEVQSEIGVGSRFTVRLPAAETASLR